jgi:hypothetical protein
MVVVVATVVVVVVVGAAVWLAASGDDAPPQDRGQLGAELSTDKPTAEQVAAALEFGHLQLTPDADVRRLVALDGVDESYQLLVAVAPGGEEQILRDSGFTATPAPTDIPDYYTVSGVEPANSDALVAAEDTIESNGTLVVTRLVMVDRSDPVRTLLHLTAFNY